jgi:hypothetical protein
MRLLIHGMQSSGATAFTLFLAQRPECLALVDIPNNFAAPRLSTQLDVVAKVVVTTAYPLAVHVERFRPDRTILLLRDPRDNYQSLRTKNYRNYSGLIEEKFQILEQLFLARQRFDAVIEYEDFVARDPAVLVQLAALGWPVDVSYYQYRRRHEELFAALWGQVPELFDQLEMSFGNVQGGEVSQRFREKPRDATVDARLEVLCPQLLAHYRTRPRSDATQG